MSTRPQTRRRAGPHTLVAAGAAAIGCVLAVAYWLFGSPPSRPAPLDGFSADGAAALAAANERAFDMPAADERSEREAALDGRRVVEGRVVHTMTREGLPYCCVFVRDGVGAEEVVSDRDGRFATQRVFGADVSVRAEDVTSRFGARRGGLWPQRRLRGLPGEPDAVPETASEWQRVSSFDAVEIGLPLGPTYFVRTVLPAGIDAATMLVALGPSELTDMFELRRHDDFTELREVADAPGEYWCRFAPDVRVDDLPAALTLCAATGLWCGRAAVRQVVGVQQEPVDVALQSPAGVHGVVRSSNGAPRNNIFVTLTQLDGDGLVRDTSRTEGGGLYAFSMLNPGPVRLQVRTEDVEPWQRTVGLVPGQSMKQDIQLASRRIGGAVAGTITTESGAEFTACRVSLASRGDTTIWREANIHWRDLGGRRVATWTFENVPVVECDVTLHTDAPCFVAQRSHRVTAPAEQLTFHVQDQLPLQTVEFHLRGVDLAEAGTWAVFVEGDAGWQLHLDGTATGATGAHLPIGQHFTWRLAGNRLRAQSGRAAAAAGEPFAVQIRGEAGFSALLVCTDVDMFGPARGVAVLADGAPIGMTDGAGKLWIDLPRQPDRIEVDPRAWRVRDDRGPSDIDPVSGAVRGLSNTATMRIFVRSVQ